MFSDVPWAKLFAFIALSLSLTGCDSGTKSRDLAAHLQPLTDPKVIAQVERFCGDCHPNPSPASFPKEQWLFEVEQGYQFYRNSNRQDLDEPVMADALRYFQSQAPETVDIPSAEEFPTHESSVEFVPSALVLSGDSTSLTSQVFWDSQDQAILFSDMTSGKLRKWAPGSTAGFRQMQAHEKVTLPPETVLAEGKHSCRAHPVDWNRDGLTDYVLGEIGSMSISDLKLGNVSLLIQNSDHTFKRFVLKEELARSFEAVPFDYDEDGDLDILIAEFGRHEAGVLSMLRNMGASPTEPLADQFKYEVIDPRHGNLGIQIADMDGDGRLDLVTAYGQEYETVEILFNRGPGQYEQFEAIRFPDPSYNSSSIRIADVDGDGKLDVIHTCGDIFDSFVPKTFHGVRVLRQVQPKQFEVIELGMLIGAMDSAIADFDQDGDLDIAAVGLFPVDSVTKRSYDSVVWFEQVEGMKFLRHSVERDHCYHAACTAADVDHDGRVDLVVGEWKDADAAGSLRVFWNTQRK